MQIKIIKVLQASEGKVLTNGEIYGRIIFLADGLDESSFYEIDEEEYNKMNEVVEDEPDL